MSTPPTKYTRKANFQSYQASTTNPIRGADMDAEFNALKTTTDQTVDRLALLQRDDGSLKNIVARDSLTADFLPQLIDDVAGGISSDKAIILAAKDATLAAQADADTARDQAVTAKTAAQSSQSAAATSETNAATSASNAAGSASSAAASAGNALASKNAAATSETNAATSATSASTSASAASTSASNATGSASTASTAATNAGNSATAAATSATNAANSATAAASSASSAAASAAGIMSGLRNAIINGAFGINQRGVSGTVTLAAGAYGHDRWKAGASGCTYTFLASGGHTVITITAGSLMQVIEGANVETGPYVLSHQGSALARIGINGAAPAGAYAAATTTAPLAVTPTGGQNVTVEFGAGTVDRAQFEPGGVATVFERRFYGQELTLCQRYYEAISFPGFYFPAGSGTLSIYIPIQFVVPKRTAPSISAAVPVGTALLWTSAGADLAPSAQNVPNISVSSARYAFSGASAVGGVQAFTSTVSAEL